MKSLYQCSIPIVLEAQATIRELRDKISRLYKVPERRLVLLQDTRNESAGSPASIGLIEIYGDGKKILEVLKEYQYVEAIETPRISEDLLTSTCIKLTLVWCNAVDQRLFGPYFCCSVDRDANFFTIQYEMMKAMKCILRETCDLNIIKNTSLFRLRITGSSKGSYYYAIS